jgi:hypothetical protein
LMRAEDLYGDLMWRSNGSAEVTPGGLTPYRARSR